MRGVRGREKGDAPSVQQEELLPEGDWVEQTALDEKSTATDGEGKVEHAPQRTSDGGHERVHLLGCRLPERETEADNGKSQGVDKSTDRVDGSDRMLNDAVDQVSRALSLSESGIKVRIPLD